ncbi:hypothetical protein MSG28_014604 [Choristoneura fumiferana]|uniref:Uncharacterized protein n=1 Tax=Choristoneura fumiferana TaxID=7141 RepID=A0ACC0JRZ5_CHOFU|nr:hypothetical protein MSG28_014604 [Choristoneura fumiferana]
MQLYGLYGASNGCILPPYPAHGTYTVHDRPEAVPGQTYGLAILKVTCDPGYRVIGNNATYCFSNNDWQHPMPRCTRFCRLTPDPSVKYFCKVTGDGILGGTRLCHELEPHGTVVVPICNYPVYYSSKVLLNMHCVDGAWDHVATCQPEADWRLSCHNQEEGHLNVKTRLGRHEHYLAYADRKMELFDSAALDCGKTPRKGQEIIITGKGTKVAHGDLPWHAAIYDKSYTPFMQVCGGSLVSTKVVISGNAIFSEEVSVIFSEIKFCIGDDSNAAHCFWNDGQHPASRYAVALGKIYRPWNDSMDLGAHKSDVKEIKMPARFFGEVAHYQDDIALVIMSTPVVYNTYIRPVCLDLDDEFDRNQLQSSSSGREISSKPGKHTFLLKDEQANEIPPNRVPEHLNQHFLTVASKHTLRCNTYLLYPTITLTDINRVLRSMMKTRETLDVYDISINTLLCVWRSSRDYWVRLGKHSFLLFINDLVASVADGLVVLFADDTTVVVRASSYMQLEERMSDVCNQLREWFAANGLIMNVTKSNVVLFKTRNHVETSHVQSPLPLCSTSRPGDCKQCRGGLALLDKNPRVLGPSFMNGYPRT